MKWIKASERLPNDDGNRPVKVNGQYAYGNFFDLDEDKRAFSVNSSCEGYVVYPEYFNVLEWLDESSPISEPSGDLVDNRCQKEKCVEEYFGLNPNHTGEKTPINTDFGHLVNLLYMWEQKEAKNTPASSVEEILKKHIGKISGLHDLTEWHKSFIYAAMQEYSQAKEKEASDWKQKYMSCEADLTIQEKENETLASQLTAKEAELKKIEDALLEITEASCKKHEETISELKYWKELAEQILLQMEFGDKRRPLEQRLISLLSKRVELIIGVNYETKSLGLMLNSDMQSNGASQEKPDSSTEADQIKNK